MEAERRVTGGPAGGRSYKGADGLGGEQIICEF